VALQNSENKDNDKIKASKECINIDNQQLTNQFVLIQNDLALH